MIAGGAKPQNDRAALLRPTEQRTGPCWRLPGLLKALHQETSPIVDASEEVRNLITGEA